MITDGRTTVWALSCDAGTSVSGTGTLSCQEDGTWSSVQPSCSKFLCESLSVRPDGTGYIPVKNSCDSLSVRTGHIPVQKKQYRKYLLKNTGSPSQKNYKHYKMIKHACSSSG